MHLPTAIVSLLSLVLVFVFYRANDDIPKTLSPQGCRMSWMSPSYILQSGFNSSWSPLAHRYSLWLYREVGWEGTPVHGLPVLFIPGNAGSSQQVRSIASSATRQFYQSPYVVSTEFTRRKVQPLDFYAVEFNEDLSAFHGPTLDSQITYSSGAISYILSHYPPSTPIIVMGHSMGGIVAVSLLPSPDISAIITMSTPHTLPPARFDSRINNIYTHNQHMLQMDATPIISLCGGATDLMILSESCILPAVRNNTVEKVFRRTIFTSALEGSWTGVGHREMVWCHQVRWRVARAALELGGASSLHHRVAVLERWLRDGNNPSLTVPATQNDLTLSDLTTCSMLPANMQLVLKNPRGSHTYLLPIPPSSSSSPSKFVLFVSQGLIPPVSPQHPNSLRVSVHLCHHQSSPSHSTGADSHVHAIPPSCTSLSPVALKLIPNPMPGKPFPAPEEGSDESEGVVVFEADVLSSGSDHTWVAVHIEDSNGAGWVIGGFAPSQHKGGVVTSKTGATGPFFTKVSIALPLSDRMIPLRTDIQLPNLLSNALIVYRLRPKADITSSIKSESACEESLFPPLLMHTSSSTEIHFFPLLHIPPHPVLLHTHSSAPYVQDMRTMPSRGLNLTIYSFASSNCITGIDIQIDWWSSFGRWGSRYLMTVLSWAIGVVALVQFRAWEAGDKDIPAPSVQQSLEMFISSIFPKLLIASFAVACLPLPTDYYLGTGGELLLAPIAPVMIFIVTGLVSVSWWILCILKWPIGRIGRLLLGQRSSGLGSRSAFISMSLILMLIFLFVPWQVAFLGCWVIHLDTCATPQSRQILVEPDAAIPLIHRLRQKSDRHSLIQPDTVAGSPTESGSPTDISSSTFDSHQRNMHILLFMTWLLPLVAHVLVVWVRTLMTAGFTVPFDGDHNFLNVAPFLLLVDARSSGRMPEIKDLWARKIVRWSFFTLGMVSIFLGPRTTYRVFDIANVVVALIVVISCWQALGI